MLPYASSQTTTPTRRREASLPLSRSCHPLVAAVRLLRVSRHAAGDGLMPVTVALGHWVVDGASTGFDRRSVSGRSRRGLQFFSSRARSSIRGLAARPPARWCAAVLARDKVTAHCHGQDRRRAPFCSRATRFNEAARLSGPAPARSLRGRTNPKTCRFGPGPICPANAEATVRTRGRRITDGLRRREGRPALRRYLPGREPDHRQGAATMAPTTPPSRCERRILANARRYGVVRRVDRP